jgi:hypothetical protein
VRDELGQKISCEKLKMQKDDRLAPGQPLTSVVEANFQSLVTAERGIRSRESTPELITAHLPHQNSNFFGDFML